MKLKPEGVLVRLIRSRLNQTATDALLDVLDIDPRLNPTTGDRVPRAAFAMAMNVLLFEDLVRRVPTGAAYVADIAATGGRVMFDHGALRTIRFAEGPTGDLPAGEDSFRRLFKPLGYSLRALYPLEALKMTGRAYAHDDFPEAIPQFFLSELHVERFSPGFAAAAERVFSSSRDPLGPETVATLEGFAANGEVSLEAAIAALAEVIGAFARHHDTPRLEDYEILLAESKEAAWIATEGSAFNHATDRVPDVVATAADQRALGRPIKDLIEVSRSGRVRQTAFKADPVVRQFLDGPSVVERTVPGSFYEFISRDPLPEGGLDLAFDSSNAQGIFKMTVGA